MLLSDVRLVNRYEELGAKVMQSTVIENEFQTTDFAKGFPEVRGLIGVMVGEENDQGWLIAINRAVPTGIDPVEWSRSEH